MRTAKAHWVTRDTIGWIGAEPSGAYHLCWSLPAETATQTICGAPLGAFIDLLVDLNGLPQWIVEESPFVRGATALKISKADLAQVPALLKGELVITKMKEARIADATGLQIAGVLDDLFYFNGELGAQLFGGVIRFRLWAPTARSVRLFVYDDPEDGDEKVYQMAEGEAGVWEVRVGDARWLNRKYYLYEVEVFSRLKGQIVTNRVTDPYSVGLAPDYLKSLVVDLDSPLSKPDGWERVTKPELAGPTDIVLYELHIRDFSISDGTVPENHTAAAGQDLLSVLDKVVPGYYYRLDRNGDVYTSTCCPNTASEHRMFFKLTLDTLKIWAREYRVDGFRFDLMGFGFKNNLLEIKTALREIEPTIYLYGEGWDFGEVASNALGVNATQANMAGTGIGTFSDRGRDVIRGGSAFDRGNALMGRQGFINGLWYDMNTFADGTLQQLLDTSDLVRQARYDKSTGRFIIPPRTTAIFVESR